MIFSKMFGMKRENSYIPDMLPFSCFLRCLSKLVCWPKHLSHKWHLKGFSLLWIFRTCLCRLDDMLKDLSQYLHLKINIKYGRIHYNPAILYWCKNRSFQNMLFPDTHNVQFLNMVIHHFALFCKPWVEVGLMNAVIAPELQIVWIFYPAGTYTHQKGQCWTNVLLFFHTNKSNSPARSSKDLSYEIIFFLKWPARCPCSAHI